jgi:chaperonin GroES
MIEQGMKVYTSIYKRLYRALKKEYGLLFALNAKHLPEEQYLTVLDSPMAIAREDYEVGSMDVMPAADPNSVTDMQKMQRAQVYLEVGTNPEAQKAGVDMRECLMPPKPAQPSPPEKLQMADAMAKVEEQEGKAMKAKAEGTIATDQAERVTRARDAEEFQKNLHGQLQAIMGGQAPEMPQPKQPRPNAANAAVNGNGRAQPVA